MFIQLSQLYFWTQPKNILSLLVFPYTVTCTRFSCTDSLFSRSGVSIENVSHISYQNHINFQGNKITSVTIEMKMKIKFVMTLSLNLIYLCTHTDSHCPAITALISCTYCDLVCVFQNFTLPWESHP